MAASKSSAKSAPAKRAASATAADTGKVKVSAKAKLAVKAEPAKKPGVAAKALPKTTPKAAPKAVPKPRAKKAGGPKPGQASTVPAEQRRHYIEMAAYYIAERRGFAPGDPLVDWVQAEAEIDRLLAEGRLGG